MRPRFEACKSTHRRRTRPRVRRLIFERTAIMAILGLFNPFAGLLTVIGDANQKNAITVSRDAAGNLLLNGGAVPIVGGRPTVANTRLITVFGRDGGDTITLDETNGALPPAELFGGAGNDVLTGGSGN